MVTSLSIEIPSMASGDIRRHNFNICRSGANLKQEKGTFQILPDDRKACEKIEEGGNVEIIEVGINLNNTNGLKNSNSISIGSFRRCIAGCEGFKVLHKVPTRIEEANLWFNLLGRPDLLNVSNTNSYRVCNLHFSEKMRGSSGKRLHYWSLPDINLPGNSVPPPVINLNFIPKFVQQTPNLSTSMQQTQIVRTPLIPSSQVLKFPLQMPQSMNTQLINVKGPPTTNSILLPNMVQSKVVNAPIIRLSYTDPPSMQYSIVQPTIRNTPHVNSLPSTQFNTLSCCEEKDMLTPISIHQSGRILECFHQELIKQLNHQELYISEPIGEDVIEVPQHLVVKFVLIKRGERLPEEHKKKVQNDNIIENNENHKCCCDISSNDADSILKKILKEPVKRKVEIGHKSIQCRLARTLKEKKDVKEEKKSESVLLKRDKCTSTEDVEENFDMFMQVEVPEIKDFRYIEDGKCECLICGKRFETSSYARTHLQMHQEKPRLCCKCGKLFKNNISCVVHERTCLSGNENNKNCSMPNERVCQYCGRYSNSIVKHLDHLNSHTGEKPHKCSCGSEFRNLTNFYTHRKKFGCKNAPAEIPYGLRIRKRKTHRKEIKVKKKEHNGDSCNALRRQRLNPDRYVCKVCGIRSRDYESFRSHRKQHITERKYICHVCNNSYKEAFSLRSHIKNTHLHRSECKYCGKRCSPFYMPIHIRTHTGERPYACVLCDQKFISNRILKTHKRNVHNIGVPPPSNKSLLKCCICNVIFASKKALENHLAKRIHIEQEEMWKEVAGVTIFTCMYCKSVFDYFGQYAGHLGSVHNSHIFRKMEEILDEFEKGISGPLRYNLDPENEPEIIEEYIEEIDLEVDQIDDDNVMSDIKQEGKEMLEVESNEIGEVCIIKSEDQIVGAEEIVSIDEHMFEFLNFQDVKDPEIEFIDQQDNMDCGVNLG